jgi:hypothetical protein
MMRALNELPGRKESTMSIVPLFFAALFIGLGILLPILRQRQARGLQRIAYESKVNLGELADPFASIREGMGEAGNFRQAVEATGIVRCATPLTAELSGRPCVHVTTTVKEHYKDSEGKAATRVVRTDVHGTPFTIEDQSGSILVSPGGATVDGDQVYCERRGGVQVATEALTAYEKKPGDYEFVESIVEVGQPIFVVGVASDVTGRLMIHRPLEKGGRFVITTKSAEDWVKQTKAGFAIYVVITVFAWLFGSAVVAASLDQFLR